MAPDRTAAQDPDGPAGGPVGPAGNRAPDEPDAVLRVADVMAGDVEFLDPDSSVQDAAILMGDIEVGCVPVGTPDHVQGLLTDRDILYRIVARGRDPRTTPVRDVLSRPVITCRPDDTVRAAMDAMAAHHIRRMPVQNPGGPVTGWITLADLARHLLVTDKAFQQNLHAATETNPQKP